MRKSKDKAELSWTKADFLEMNVEVPEKLENDDFHTEGELMTRDEIASWLQDIQKTFIVIKQDNKQLFDKLYQKYLIDIHYLGELGKLSGYDTDELLKIDRFDI